MVDKPGGGRAFIHVGTPKSGTTFIQASLVANRDELLEQGILYPTDDQGEMFRAASEMRERYIRVVRPPSELAGTWAKLCARARAFPGTTVLSSELLGGAQPHQIAQMLAELRDLEVHVVLTTRSLARQVPAAWQQSLKQGGRASFADYRQAVMSTAHADGPATDKSFWRAHDIVGVLSRWGASLPAAHVHLVTVPVTSTDPLLLWRRFCSVIGADAEQCPPSFESGNTSLGVVEIEVLRQVNRLVHRRGDRKHMAKLVNRYLVSEMLRRHTSPRPETPSEMIPELEEIWAQTCAAVEAAGYDVVGDLQELRPLPPEGDPVDPDKVGQRDVIRRASAVIVDMLAEMDGLRREVRKLRKSIPQEPSGDKPSDVATAPRGRRRARAFRRAP